jgi:hypothetical protein
MDRADMERILAEHVHPLPSAEEVEELHRRLRGQEEQAALLRSLPLTDEEAPTPPLREARP